MELLKMDDVHAWTIGPVSKIYNTVPKYVLNLSVRENYL